MSTSIYVFFVMTRTAAAECASPPRRSSCPRWPAPGPASAPRVGCTTSAASSPSGAAWRQAPTPQNSQGCGIRDGRSLSCLKALDFSPDFERLGVINSEFAFQLIRRFQNLSFVIQSNGGFTAEKASRPCGTDNT